ncbi:DEAD/DEAH box helicase [Clostridium uliginosum]|uniref:DEAD/DEAH box helicase n=1 Tax=Clostridium uliginosum TaxID=119641 RepID=A0A1I1QQB7_9CLOT|nr:DEAD/DEAH box helicase [Clostridium uliginosum]SFD24316.1 hypothetical protein SAMN05421842_12649 [Clostridium uliginosum]
MNRISSYSLNLIHKISEAKEISYYELKKIFEKYETVVEEKYYNSFNLDMELARLEQSGVVTQEDGLIIFQGA